MNVHSKFQVCSFQVISVLKPKFGICAKCSHHIYNAQIMRAHSDKCTCTMRDCQLSLLRILKVINAQWFSQKMLNSVQSDECTTSDTGKCTRQKEFHVDKSTVTPNVFTKVFLMSIRQLRVRWYVEMMRQEMWVVSTNAWEICMIIHILGPTESRDIWWVSKWPSFFVTDHYIQGGIREGPINLSRELSIATSAFLDSVLQKLHNKGLRLTRLRLESWSIWTTISHQIIY